MIFVEQSAAAKRLLGPTRRGDLALDDAGGPRVLVRSGVEPSHDFAPAVGLAANWEFGY